jgi:hypothetical protein
MADAATTVGGALPVDVASLVDVDMLVAVALRADAQLGDFTVAQFAVAERFAAEAAVSTAVVVADTVAVADMAADTGKFVRGLI